MEMYTPTWLATQEYTHEWGHRALLASFAHLGIPESILDLGCGDGYLVRLASKLGIHAVGVDIALPHQSESIDSFSYLIRNDLRKLLDFGTDFDWVICLETAEHLPEESADILCYTIRKHCRNTLIFTAAIPGQDGEGHINCQEPEYWKSKLAVEFDYKIEATEHLKETWKWATGPCFWLPQNLMVFERRHT